MDTSNTLNATTGREPTRTDDRFATTGYSRRHQRMLEASANWRHAAGPWAWFWMPLLGWPGTSDIRGAGERKLPGSRSTYPRGLMTLISVIIVLGIIAVLRHTGASGTSSATAPVEAPTRCVAQGFTGGC